MKTISDKKQGPGCILNSLDKILQYSMNSKSPNNVVSLGFEMHFVLIIQGDQTGFIKLIQCLQITYLICFALKYRSLALILLVNVKQTSFS